MSLSGMVEIPCLRAKRRFVMPAKAGIHLRACCKAKQNLDSGLRRNDDTEESTSSRRIREALGLKPRVFQLKFFQLRSVLGNIYRDP